MTINLWPKKQEYTVAKEHSSINGAGKTEQLHTKGRNGDHFITPYTKIN